MPIPNKILEQILLNDDKFNKIKLCSQYPAIHEDDIKTLVTTIHQVNNTCIKTIMLNDNTIGDDGLRYLSELKAIETLCISGNEITDEGVKLFDEHNMLTNLDLSSNLITDKGLAQVLKLPKLKSLLVPAAAIGQESAVLLLTYKTLEELVVFGDEFLQIDALTFKQIMTHVEDNKKRAGTITAFNKSLASSQPQFFQKASQNSGKENIEQRLLKKHIELFTQSMGAISSQKRREAFKKILINTLIELPISSDSPEYNG